MTRDLIYRISENEEGQKVSTFLKGQGYSKQCLVNLKKDPEAIIVNEKIVLLNHKLQKNDCLQVHMQEKEGSKQIIPVELPLEIVYEDEDLLVVNKAAGMPIHPSRNNPDNSLANALVYYYQQQNELFTFRCINRLDRDTSGLTIVAKNMLSGALLGQMVAAKTQGNEAIPAIKREYRAIVQGHPSPEAGVIDAPIARQEELDVERIVDYARGDRAVTHYKVLKQQGDYSLVSLVLETGRTHQIRVHMKHLGYPLIGDYLYNPQAMDQISRQALHAYRLEFVHPITKEKMEFVAPLPEDMRQILQ